MGVSGEDDIDFGHLSRKLPGHCQAGMGERDDEIGIFARADFFDVITQTRHPRGVHAVEFGWRLAFAGADVGHAENDGLYALPNDGDRRREEALPAGDVVKVVAHNRKAELRHEGLEALGAIDRVPVARDEDVDTEGLKWLQNCLAFGPGCWARPLKFVASIQQQARVFTSWRARARSRS